MLERLRQTLLGPRSVSTNALDGFNDTTPHRFRTWLADPADAERVPDALAAARFAATPFPAIATTTPETDGRLRVDIETAPGRRATAVLAALDALHGADIGVRGFEALDLSGDVDDRELIRTVEGAAAMLYERTFTRRLEALAGEAVIRRALAERARLVGRHGKGSLANAWRIAASSAAFNSPGGEVVLIDGVVNVKDSLEFALVNDAGSRIRLCLLTDLPWSLDEETLVGLIKRRDEVSYAAIELLEQLQAPPSAPIVDALCAVARRPGWSAVRALRALRLVAPSPRVREALEVGLESKDPDAPGVALQTLAELYGVQARPAWEAFLASRSAYRRLDGEEVLGKFGDADDVPRAAELLAKLIRSKPATETVPPRATHLIKLLVRHRDHAGAQAAFADLANRWSRLTPDVRGWIASQHPWLVPPGTDESATATAASPADELPPEPTLFWPAPTVERSGDEIRLEFEEMDGRVRDRFGELIEADPRFTVIDGDREWLTLRVDGADAESLIAGYWAAAHESGP